MIMIIIAVISKTWYLTDEGEHTVIYKIKNYIKPQNNIESQYCILRTLNPHTHAHTTRTHTGTQHTEEMSRG